MSPFGRMNEIGGSRGRTQGRREFLRNMTRLTNTRREYLARAVLHDLDSADKIIVYYDSANGFGFGLTACIRSFIFKLIPTEFLKSREIYRNQYFFSSKG